MHFHSDLLTHKGVQLGQMHVVLHDLQQQQQRLSHLVATSLHNYLAPDYAEVTHLPLLPHMALSHPIHEHARFELRDAMPHVVDAGATQVERLPCDEEVQGVVVEGGDVRRLPSLVLEALPQLVLQNVAMRAVQEALHLLPLCTPHGPHIHAPHCPYSSLQHSPQLLLNELLLVLIYGNDLSEIS